MANQTETICSDEVICGDEVCGGALATPAADDTDQASKSEHEDTER